METSVVGTSGAAFGSRQPTSRGLSDLRSEDFFGLLIAELQSQDPLNPTDNQQLLAQMSSIHQMQQSTMLNETLQALAAEQRFGGTAGLISHYVSGTVTNGAGEVSEVQGVVVGVRYESGGRAILELHNGLSLPADQVEQVTLVENLPPEILEQLQQELGEDVGGGGDPEGGAEDDGGSAAARAVVRDPVPNRTTAGAALRGIGDTAQTTANLLDALLAPGLSVGL